MESLESVTTAHAVMGKNAIAMENINLPRLSLKGIAPRLPLYALEKYKQEQFLSLYPVKDCRPHIVEFSPWSAVPSSLIVIIGHGFSPRRKHNTVMVGGSKALVVTAERHRLVVICSFHVKSGPIYVKTHDGEATGPRDFKVLSWPLPFLEVDGPPFSFEGVGDSAAVDLRTRLFGRHQAVDFSTTLRTLDVPTVATIGTTLANVTTYYTQASYSQLDLAFDVVGFFKMANKRDHYLSFPDTALPQLQAECLNFAGNIRNLDDYMVIINMNTFIRGLGGGSVQNVSFYQAAGADQDALSINITLAEAAGFMALGVGSNWGRVAHEFGHSVVNPGMFLPEDIYSSGPPAEDFSGAKFDLMGMHDSHPLFSGYNTDGLGWFSPSNVRVFSWTASPFSQEIEIVVHGLTQNTNPSRCHLVRINVTVGLRYYIETLELLVIPLREMKDLKTKIANVRVQGCLPWSYTTPQPISKLPTASTFRLIGGIQTIVAPKVGSKITLQPNPSRGDNTVTVRGSVTPTTEGQNVRVDMTFVDTLRMTHYSAQTNARGDFTATFSFLQEVRMIVEVAFQAHIINATVLAPADSNIVHYEATVVPRDPEPPA